MTFICYFYLYIPVHDIMLNDSGLLHLSAWVPEDLGATEVLLSLLYVNKINEHSLMTCLVHTRTVWLLRYTSSSKRDFT